MKVKWNVTRKEAVEAVAVLQEVEPDLKILDVGGAIKPFVFATHLIDILPYEARASYGYIPDEALRGAERFTEETWLTADICDGNWPYEDDYFDVVWCTQTIEDVRDPIGVLREISRVGKVGYLNTIDRNFESLPDVNGPDFAGFVHHRWLIEREGDHLKFVFKYPLLTREEFQPKPSGRKELGLWWTGKIVGYEEFHAHLMEIEKYLTDYVQASGKEIESQ